MKYAKPEEVYKDEQGKAYGCRMIEDNNYLSNIQGTGSHHGESIYIGDEAILELVAKPEFMVFEKKDFGRDMAMAWFFYGGFFKEWDLTADDTNATGKGIERILHVTST
jgi:hypothetical protein